MLDNFLRNVWDKKCYRIVVNKWLQSFETLWELRCAWLRGLPHNYNFCHVYTIHIGFRWSNPITNQNNGIQCYTKNNKRNSEFKQRGPWRATLNTFFFPVICIIYLMTVRSITEQIRLFLPCNLTELVRNK